MQPLVSVVVPVLNGLPHLKTLTDSILEQTYGNLDIVFSDGGSTDGSGEYLQGINDPRVRIVTIPRSATAAMNWTNATNAARGEYIKLVCQDDVLKPAAIQLQVSDLQKHPSAVMATARRDIIDAHDKVVYSPRGLSTLLHKHGEAIPTIDAIRTCYVKGTNVFGEPLAVLFRAEALKSVMPWNDENPLMLDLSTYERIAPLGDVVIRRDSVGAFRVSTASWSTRIAHTQLQQTRFWQESFADGAYPPITVSEHARAVIGRNLQTTMRRLAYTWLRIRGSMAAKG